MKFQTAWACWDFPDDSDSREPYRQAPDRKPDQIRLEEPYSLFQYAFVQKVVYAPLQD